MNHTCLGLPSQSWFSFTDLGGIEGWVGLGATTASKQSAQDRYVTSITLVSCSKRSASQGNWIVAAMSVELTIYWAMSPDPIRQ